jgi:type I restriction enzyme S subunit
MKTKSKQKNKIPDGWEVKKLGEISKIYDGTHQTPKYVEKGIPFLSVEHITANQFSNTKFVTEEVYSKEIEKVKIVNGDILMTKIGDIGTAKYINWNIEASFYVTLALFKTFDKNTDNRFLTYLINSKESQREIWKKSIHVAFPNKINLGDIGNCIMPFPPLSEQNRIVSVLETWDSGIEKLKQKIAIKKEIKKGLMQELLTGKKRLPGFSEEWKKVRLGDVCSVNMGQSPESDNYNKKSEGMVLIQGNADLKNSKTIARVYTTQITKTADYGDILFTVRAPVGAIGYISQDRVCIGRGVCSIKEKDSYLAFIFYKLKHHKNGFLRYEQGSTFSAINGKDIRSFKMQVPDLEEQKLIASILTTSDKEIVALQLKLSYRQEQKKYLLNSLVTGQMRTPENLLELINHK